MSRYFVDYLHEIFDASTRIRKVVKSKVEFMYIFQEQHSENQERNTLIRDVKSSDTLTSTITTASSTDYDDITTTITNVHRDLSAQCSSNEATALTFSGDESDNKPSDDGGVGSGGGGLDNSQIIDNHLRKRTFVLQELVDTEERYVRDLDMIVDGYMKMMRDPDCEIQMPEDLKNGKDKMIFGNIEAIYEWHRK